MFKTTDYPAYIAEAKRQIANVAFARLARRPQAGTSEKLRSIVTQPVQTYQKAPFLKEGADFPMGVVSSVIRRRAEIWGRFEV